MNREELIAHLEKSVVPVGKWRDRDSASAHRQLGECLVLIKAGCEFVLFQGNGPIFKDSSDTLEIEVQFPGFTAFENGKEFLNTETFYAPSVERLDEAQGRDWY